MLRSPHIRMGFGRTGRRPVERDIFEEEHLAFRDLVTSFIAKEIAPHHDQWERDGMGSRDVWLAAGRAGLLGIEIDEKYGGGGNQDYRYYMILGEELSRAGTYGPGFAVHNDIIGPYFQRLGTPEQCERWLPGYCSGEIITAIAMSEPGAGSDLQGMRTSAVRDGDHYVLNGQKTFISNGQLCDLVIVAARTDPEAGYRGISLLAVERGMAGFERGRNLDKLGGARGVHAGLVQVAAAFETRHAPQPGQARHARPGHLRAVLQ